MLKKLFEDKVSKKYDIVTEKYVGDGNKGLANLYLIFILFIKILNKIMAHV